MSTTPATSTGSIVAPVDYLRTPAAVSLFANYVAVQTRGTNNHARPVHLTVGHTPSWSGTLLSGHSTLCGKQAGRMHAADAAGRPVTCGACVVVLRQIHEDEAGQEAPAPAVEEFVSAEVASVGGNAEVLRGLAVVSREDSWRHLAERTGDLTARGVTLCGLLGETEVLDGDRFGVTCSTCVGAAHARRSALAELPAPVEETRIAWATDYTGDRVPVEVPVDENADRPRPDLPAGTYLPEVEIRSAVEEDELVDKLADAVNDALASTALAAHPLAGVRRVRFRATGIVADVEATGVTDAGEFLVMVDGYAHDLDEVEALTPEEAAQEDDRVRRDLARQANPYGVRRAAIEAVWGGSTNGLADDELVLADPETDEERALVEAVDYVAEELVENIEEATAQAQDEAIGGDLFAYSPATQEFGDALAERDAREAQAARRAAVDAALRNDDLAAGRTRAEATDGMVARLREAGEDGAADAVVEVLASNHADRCARRRRAERRGIAQELVNIEGDLDENHDGAVARDVLDLLDRTGDLVRVSEGYRYETGEVRTLVGFKANAAERGDLDDVTEFLRATTDSVSTASDAIRHVVGLYAALVRASAEARA